MNIRTVKVNMWGSTIGYLHRQDNGLIGFQYDVERKNPPDIAVRSGAFSIRRMAPSFNVSVGVIAPTEKRK